MITLITPRIRRITIPYKDIYTSVFILDTKDGTILFDTAFSNYDVDTFILPELTRRNLRYIFISHNHRDHAWGLDRLMEVQQRISTRLNDEKVGKSFRTIIDRIEGDYYVGRTEYDSPDVDTEVLISRNERDLEIGAFYNVLITDSTEFDLMGTVNE